MFSLEEHPSREVLRTCWLMQGRLSRGRMFNDNKGWRLNAVIGTFRPDS